MDEMITKKTIDTMPATPAVVSHPTILHEHIHNHRSTRILAIVLGAVLVLVAVLIIWFQFSHKKAVLSPAQTLQNLKDSSQPVTATPEQRAAALSAAQKNSVQYTVTTQQRVDTLNALKR